MKVDENYIEQLAVSKSVFDMAAICYQILDEEIANPIAFISQYMDENPENGKGSLNTNYLLLRNFSDEVAELLETYSESNFVYRRSCIIEKIHKLELKSFLDPSQNQLAVICTLLSTIDSLIPFWDKDALDVQSALNRTGSCNSYFVYLSDQESLLSDLIKKIGRERKCEGNFQETLCNLILIKKENLPKNAEPPDICLLTRKSKSEPHHFKVAAITGITGIHFEFPKATGSTVTVNYTEETQGYSTQRYIAMRICSKMKTAIRQGAEFIILPEFCISKEVLEYIKKKLAEWKKDTSLFSNLIAVFPGSTWTSSNDNVQFILDAWGREIGNYYKATPYRKKRKDGKGYECCEGLTNPGLRTCLLWIDRLGYILPATCRDVIDSEYTRLLVQKFHPAFLMVPAWSSSGSSFKQPLEEYAADYFTNSVLCNGCGALKGMARIVGGVSVLDKKGTVPVGHFKAVAKPSQQKQPCSANCRKYCSYLFCIDFSPEKSGFKNRIYAHKL